MARTLLSVDDSSDDLLLLRMACAAAKVGFCFQTVDSGEAAIAYLGGKEAYSDRRRFPFPDLVLLDLKMPGKSGFEVLEWKRQNPQCRQLPVVVFTSSVQAEDRARALALGATLFLVKPVGYQSLRRFVQTVDHLLIRDTPLTRATLQLLADREFEPSH